MTKFKSFILQVKYASIFLFLLYLLIGPTKDYETGGMATLIAVIVAGYLGVQFGIYHARSEYKDARQSAMDAGIVAGYDMGRTLSKTPIETLGKKKN